MLVKKILNFWKYINDAEFEQLTKIMVENSIVILPNTREIFKGRNNYIVFNKEYPGRWYARVEKIVAFENQVISVVEITNTEGVSLYVTSFFIFEDNMIKEITEYWGENGEAPEWRINKGFSEKY